MDIRKSQKKNIKNGQKTANENFRKEMNRRMGNR